MAGNIVTRIVRAVFDRGAADKVATQLNDSLAQAGAKAGASFLTELRKAFDRRMADLKTALAKGLISPEEYKVQGAAAAKSFNAGLLKGMEEAQKAGTLTDSAYLKLSRTLKTVGTDGEGLSDIFTRSALKIATWAASFFALQRIVAFFRESVAAAIESEHTISSLGNALENLGMSYRQVSPAAEKLLDTIMATTRFGDEDARTALTKLITITGDYQKSLELLNLTADVAAYRQTSMAEAAVVVGKASLGIGRGLGDMGIKTKETTGLIEKMREAVGGWAEKEGKDFGGQLKIINNQWDEFKEKIGNAIIGSRGATESTTSLTAALINLNAWALKNQDGLGRIATAMLRVGLAAGWVVDKIFGMVDGFIRINNAGETFWKFIAKGVDPTTALALALDTLKNKAQTTATAVVNSMQWMADALRHGRPKPLTPEEQAAQDAAEAAAAQRAKDFAKAMSSVDETIAADARERRVQYGKATEALARKLDDELAEIERLAGDKRTAQLQKEIDAKYKIRLAALVEANKQARLGTLDGMAPTVVAATDPSAGLTGRQEDIIQPRAIGAASSEAAKKFVSPWQKAMNLLGQEVDAKRGLFAELGQAWAEGGIAGVGKWAKMKVVENIASAIEETAKMFGSLAMGDAKGATAHGTSAVEHGLAAAAWEVVGAVTGSGGASAAGGAGGTGTGTPSGTGESTKPASQEITVVFSGPGFNALNPVVQEVMFGAQQQIRERYGNNVRIHTIRRSQ